MPAKHQLSILVVDDTTVSRALICDALHHIGITKVAIAKDGQHALEVIKATPANLVISDMNMPNLDGLGLLKALRTNGPTQKVGFILVTGLADKTLIEQGKKFGLNNFLPKPFTHQTVRACIEAVVGKLV